MTAVPRSTVTLQASVDRVLVHADEPGGPVTARDDVTVSIGTTRDVTEAVTAAASAAADALRRLTGPEKPIAPWYEARP